MTSCERSEGEGGKATIEGFVYKIVDDGVISVKDSSYTDENGMPNSKRVYSFITDTIVAAKEDVFIIYGDDQFYGDDIETDFEGRYQFRYLVEGNYTVFAYNNLKDKVLTAETHSLQIGKTGLHRVPDIYIRDGKNASLSAIVGRVKAMYDGQFNPKERMDVSVFIKQVGTVGPLNDVETDDEGYFVFTELNPGKYEVWIETEGFEGGIHLKDQIDALVEEVEIDGSERIVVMEDPMIMYLTYEKE
jgi:hypothetical protein